MKLDEIPVGEGRTMAVGDQQVAVFRLRSGGLRALGAVCPHLGGPLADGLLDEKVVLCPLHGRSYDLVTGVETSLGDSPVCAYTVAVNDDGELHVTPA